MPYDPNDAKKSKLHQHRASGPRKSEVEYLFVNSGAPSTSGAPTVSAGASTSSAGGKVKKAKPKNSSISGPSTIAAAGPAKPRRTGGPSKKPSQESQTSGEFSAISTTVEDPFGSSETQLGTNSRHNIASLMNAPSTYSDNPTPASDRYSVAPSATPGPEPSPRTEAENSPVSVDQSWSAPAEIGSGRVPTDTTADDDIMADLEMAEQKPRKRGNVAPPPPPPQISQPPPPSTTATTTTNMVQKRDEELQMELEMDILRGMEESPKKSPLPPHVQPTPAPKKSGSRSSIASPSPAPSSFTPSRTPVPVAQATGAKKSGPKAAKPKAKAPAKKKADTVKGKGAGGGKGESDWTWGGTSSGRAAAAAAANALLGGGYGDDGHGGRDSVPPVHAREEEVAEDDEEDDKRLYCICRELYDNRFMLGCDK